LAAERWSGSQNSSDMLGERPSRTSSRKLRLFAVACCHRVRYAFRSGWEERALDLAERMADGANQEDWFDQLMVSELGPGMDPAADAVASAVLWWDRWLAIDNVADRVVYASWYRTERAGEVAEREERAAQADLLRDILGNPFRRVKFSREWRTSTAV